MHLEGPNGGKVSSGGMTPAGARELAQELLDAADQVDPPKQLPEHNIYYRGYEIEPLDDKDNPCPWYQASSFRVYRPDDTLLPGRRNTLNHTRQMILEDIEAQLSPYAKNAISRPPNVIGRELDRLQAKIGQATRALQSVSSGGMLEAKRILSE
jgi:hypothetical protein